MEKLTDKVICVVGPTASGKTDLAVGLALALDGEVVSCDSMQIYSGLDIGTAKPTTDEMRGVPHHMLGVIGPNEKYSVSRYVEDASACITEILGRGRVPIVAGGTGLYMDSLIKGIYFSNVSEDGILRERLAAMYDRNGGKLMHRLLNRMDPQTAQKLHPNDKNRICRALEVRFGTDKPISQHNKETQSIQHRYNALYIGIGYKNRDTLYGRIDSRVDIMYSRGLVREVTELLPTLHDGAGAFQAIGYKEIIRALKEGRSAEDAAEEIKTASRRYAKRQLTWLRRNKNIRWFYRDEQNDSEILQTSTNYSGSFLYNANGLDLP